MRKLDKKPAHGTKPLLERFWEKVEIRSDKECWEWKACINKRGYGFFMLGRTSVVAYKCAWYFVKGDVPEGLLLRHTCDNTKCCNPYHLIPGTVQDNSDDMVSRGRSMKGVKNPLAKLDDQKVREIRLKGLYKKQTELSQEYGVTRRVIRMVLNRETWSHVTP